MYPLKQQLLAFTVIFTLLILKDSSTLAELEGDNVCQRIEQIIVNVTRQISTPYKTTTSQLCLRPPFKCIKEKLVYKPETVEEQQVTNKSFNVCCDGYAKAGNRCIRK